MANASKNNMGSGAQGKGSGEGAMSELPEDMLGENMVLSNRDKAQHSDSRGLDSKEVQTQQYRDHETNHRTFDEKAVTGGDDNTSGNKGSRTNASGEDSSLKSQRDS